MVRSITGCRILRRGTNVTTIRALINETMADTSSQRSVAGSSMNLRKRVCKMKPQSASLDAAVDAWQTCRCCAERLAYLE